MDTGFFNMDIIKSVTEASSLEEAKQLAHTAVDAMPNAKASNINKVKRVIDNSSSLEKLAISMTNFMFAHPSENLAVLK